jgi:hypothetical protein
MEFAVGNGVFGVPLKVGEGGTLTVAMGVEI